MMEPPPAAASSSARVTVASNSPQDTGGATTSPEEAGGGASPPCRGQPPDTEAGAHKPQSYLSSAAREGDSDGGMVYDTDGGLDSSPRRGNRCSLADVSNSDSPADGRKRPRRSPSPTPAAAAAAAGRRHSTPQQQSSAMSGAAGDNDASAMSSAAGGSGAPRTVAGAAAVIRVASSSARDMPRMPSSLPLLSQPLDTRGAADDVSHADISTFAVLGRTEMVRSCGTEYKGSSAKHRPDGWVVALAPDDRREDDASLSRSDYAKQLLEKILALCADVAAPGGKLGDSSSKVTFPPELVNVCYSSKGPASKTMALLFNDLQQDADITPEGFSRAVSLLEGASKCIPARGPQLEAFKQIPCVHVGYLGKEEIENVRSERLFSGASSTQSTQALAPGRAELSSQALQPASLADHSTGGGSRSRHTAARTAGTRYETHYVPFYHLRTLS
jgi:hypothetical protein